MCWAQSSVNQISSATKRGVGACAIAIVSSVHGGVVYAECSSLKRARRLDRYLLLEALVAASLSFAFPREDGGTAQPSKMRSFSLSLSLFSSVAPAR